MAFLRSPCPPPALDQILASRLPAICPDALHLPRRRHAFRYCLRPQRSRLLGRVPPRVHAGLSPPASPGRRAPLRPNPAGDSPRSRTRTFFRVPPPPYPLQLSFLYSLPDADRHARRLHPHPFSHSHHARPLRRWRIRPARRLPRRRSGAYLRHRPRQVCPRPRHPGRKQNHPRLAAHPSTPRADFSSRRKCRESPPSSRRPRRLGRPFRHFAQSSSRRAARRRPHPSIRQPARASPHFASSSRDLGFHRIPLLARLVSLGRTAHRHPFSSHPAHLQSRTVRLHSLRRRFSLPPDFHPLLHASPLPRVAIPLWTLCSLLCVLCVKPYSFSGRQFSQRGTAISGCPPS